MSSGSGQDNTPATLPPSRTVSLRALLVFRCGCSWRRALCLLLLVLPVLLERCCHRLTDYKAIEVTMTNWWGFVLRALKGALSPVMDWLKRAVRFDFSLACFGIWHGRL